jgi:hypothetical protein
MEYSCSCYGDATNVSVHSPFGHTNHNRQQYLSKLNYEPLDLVCKSKHEGEEFRVSSFSVIEASFVEI